MTTETVTVDHTNTHMTAEGEAQAAAAAAALPDVRPQLRGALRLAAATAWAVTPDQLDDPTPCSEYDVDALVRHLAGAVDRLVQAGGSDVIDDLEEYPGVAPAAVVDALTATVEAFDAAWADDARLDRFVTLPWATLPARVLLAIYLSEMSVHTWDVAVATGQQPAFDDAAVELALVSMQMGLPAEGRDQTPFGEVQPVADDAPAIERLVAWTGRNPAWRGGAA